MNAQFIMVINKDENWSVAELVQNNVDSYLIISVDKALYFLGIFHCLLYMIFVFDGYQHHSLGLFATVC